MNLVSKKLCLVFAASGFALAGCVTTKRTDPSQTVPTTAIAKDTKEILPPDPFKTEGPGDRPPGITGDGQHGQFGEASQVYFDYDRSDIKASERAKFPAVKEYLAKNPGARILFEGHADWRGTEEYNLSLGDRRASAAKNYLQSLGVKSDQIEIMSKGSLEAAKSGDDVAMAKDRRVEIVIVPAPAPGAKPAI